MRLTTRTATYIKIKISNIVKEYNLTYPIDPFILCEKMGYVLVKYSDLSPEVIEKYKNKNKNGFKIEDSDGTIYIIYNDIKDIRIIKFTILHEIGHIVLGHLEESELAETQANFFAGFLLAPPVIIIYLNICDDINKISKVFGITYSCADSSNNRANSRKKYGPDYLEDYEQIFMDLAKGVII